VEADDNELLILDKPTNYMETIYNIDSKKWLEFMIFEMDSIYINQAWTLVDLPEGVNPIGCK
jgi:uncharacterized UPF0160 family protein